MKFKRFYIFFAFLAISAFFLRDIFLHGHLPVPADILVGHFYPWKDYVWLERTAGIPIRNFQLYDAVKQMYPWRFLSVEALKAGFLPLWNPYSFMGTPHVGNIAAATFYPINLIFLVLPFLYAWVVHISLQTILASSFMYLFLKNKSLPRISAFFGAIIFAFSSLMMTRYELGIIGHTALWLPLILLSIDKLSSNKHNRWFFVGIGALAMMFLGGFFQFIFYAVLLVGGYTLTTSKKKLLVFAMVLLAIGIASLDLIPFFAVVAESSRFSAGTDFVADVYESFTLSVPQLVIGLAPDFFGSPATGNYILKTDYSEYAFYAGIIPTALALYAAIFKRKQTWFFAAAVLLSFLFLVKNPIAQMPFSLNIPGISSLLPTRLNFIIDFGIAVLAAYGLADLVKDDKKTLKRVSFSFAGTTLLMGVIWALLIYSPEIWGGQDFVASLEITKKNLILPTIYVLTGASLVFSLFITKKRFHRFAAIALLVLITVFDLTRQGRKFNSFSDPEIVFPKVAAIEAIVGGPAPPRYMISHNQLFPADTNIIYNLSSINGYDSVHSLRVEELITAVEHGDAAVAIKTERNIEPHNIDSTLANLLSVEYILTWERETEREGTVLVAEHGLTRVYKNTAAYPRAYLTKDVRVVSADKTLAETINIAQSGSLAGAVSESVALSEKPLSISSAEIIDFSFNKITVKTSSDADALLILNETYDKDWQALVDGSEVEVLPVNHALRGVVVPEGEHEIIFEYRPKAFYIGIIISGVCILITISLFMIYVVRVKKRS